MTDRQAFLNALSARTSGMPEAERARLAEYFADMIDDRVEMGMSEADAVAALGDVDALLREAAPIQPPAPLPGEQAYRGPIREVFVHLRNSDARILAAPLSEGLAARISATDSRRFTWRMEDGALTVTEVEGQKRGFFQRTQEITLTLSDAMVPVKLIADAYGGDIDVRDVKAEEMIVIAASSGDICLERCACRGRVELTTRSGDIELKQVEAARDLRAEAMAGDVSVKRAAAPSLRLRAASGDIDGRALRAGRLAASASSGDIGMDDVEAGEALLCETASGDIDLTRTAAPDIRLSTDSGDIDVRLLPRAEGYDAQAHSQTGDIAVDAGHAGPDAAKVEARSASGDIDIRVTDRA